MHFFPTFVDGGGPSAKENKFSVEPETDWQQT